MSRFQEAEKKFADKNKVVKPIAAQEVMTPEKKAQQLKQMEMEVNRKIKPGTSMDVTLKHLHEIAVTKGQDDYRGTIPEHIFVSYFLPYFRQGLDTETEVSDELREYRQKVLTDWISVAGTLMNEVNVIDNRRQVLFTVPALANTAVINPVRKDGAPAFMDIAVMAERLRMISPAQSANYENDRLHQKVMEMSNGKHRFKDNEHRWIDIFNRYPLTEEEKKVSGNKNSAQSSKDEDELEYD